MSSAGEGTTVLDRQSLDPKLKEFIKEDAPPKEGFVFCASCSHVIGHVQDRIEVNGSFQHTCTNPYGFVHHFGCHSDAHGCAIAGKAHSAESWFQGYSWRLANCGNCDAHMGWLFERADEHFYGLIFDRIQVG